MVSALLAPRPDHHDHHAGRLIQPNPRWPAGGFRVLPIRQRRAAGRQDPEAVASVKTPISLPPGSTILSWSQPTGWTFPSVVGYLRAGRMRCGAVCREGTYARFSGECCRSAAVQTRLHAPSFPAVIPAAGLSRRMETPKQLLPWRQDAILTAVIDALQAGGCASVVCALELEAPRIAASLPPGSSRSCAIRLFAKGKCGVQFAGLPLCAKTRPSAKAKSTVT